MFFKKIVCQFLVCIFSRRRQRNDIFVGSGSFCLDLTRSGSKLNKKSKKQKKKALLNRDICTHIVISHVCIHLIKLVHKKTVG